MSARQSIRSEEVAQVEVEVFNRRLKKLRRRARKARAGEGGRKARNALRRLKKLKRLGLATSCCAKSYRKRCSACPRNAPELVLAPLGD